jgi:hypothetical protein
MSVLYWLSLTKAANEGNTGKVIDYFLGTDLTNNRVNMFLSQLAVDNQRYAIRDIVDDRRIDRKYKIDFNMIARCAASQGHFEIVTDMLIRGANDYSILLEEADKFNNTYARIVIEGYMQ